MDYSSDVKNIYYKDKKVPGADLGTFKTMADSLNPLPYDAMDKKEKYLEGEVVIKIK